MGIRRLVTRRYAYIAVRTRNRASKRPKNERVSQLCHPLGQDKKSTSQSLSTHSNVISLTSHSTLTTVHTTHTHQGCRERGRRKGEEEEKQPGGRGERGDATIEILVQVKARGSYVTTSDCLPLRFTCTCVIILIF
ncbi:hypothetical protein Scep_009611 [Stephania cephalantha]|uniref:Uncharacterized protein n=1 Tax=Stephania cephalantha TaxID=152367 RepID=A0AAP0PGC7_9MAGN